MHVIHRTADTKSRRISMRLDLPSARAKINFLTQFAGDHMGNLKLHWSMMDMEQPLSPLRRVIHLCLIPYHYLLRSVFLNGFRQIRKGGLRAWSPLQHISMIGIWLDLMFNIPPKDAPTEAPEKSKDL